MRAVSTNENNSLSFSNNDRQTLLYNEYWKCDERFSRRVGMSSDLAEYTLFCDRSL